MSCRRPDCSTWSASRSASGCGPVIGPDRWHPATRATADVTRRSLEREDAGAETRAGERGGSRRTLPTHAAFAADCAFPQPHATRARTMKAQDQKKTEKKVAVKTPKEKKEAKKVKKEEKKRG